MFDKLKRWFNFFLIVIGSWSLILAAGAFTRIPYDVQVWLGTKNSSYKFKPDYIVFLGGSGMPSGDNLVRLYYTAQISKKITDATVIIAHPIDTSVIALMRSNLILNGIDSSRILLITEGTNTRQQALKISNFLARQHDKNLLLITSPEYMYRSVATFRKGGFSNVGGIAAFENAMFIDLKYSDKEAGGKAYLPDVSGSIDLRYNFWNYLKLEITCMREFIAIGYYKLNGWM